VRSLPRDRLRYAAADRDSWTQPGSTAALVLSSVVWVLWWAASLIGGSIWLAIRRHRDGMTDEIWGSGDRR
jgi:hypothetical protein